MARVLEKCLPDVFALMRLELLTQVFITLADALAEVQMLTGRRPRAATRSYRA
jgi:hypothetical protein